MTSASAATGSTADSVVLAVDNLQAGYGDRVVVRNLSLTVRSGELVGLFGANGAGKTTVLSTVAGLLPVLGGDVDLFGRRQRAAVPPYRRAGDGVCLVPEGRGLFRQLTVAENLRLAWRGRGRRTATDQVLESFPKLQPLQRRQAGTLSGGEQQMLVLARALLTKPKLLLIDEMSLGLAPMVAERLLALVREQAQEHGIAVLVVEQHIPLALRYVDSGHILSHGSLMRSGSAAQLSQDTGLLAATYFGGTSTA